MDENLQVLAGALRATRNRQTGYTPNMLMLGREVVQPIDVLLGTAAVNQPEISPQGYVTELRSSLAQVHAMARNALQSSQAIQKRDYDIKVRAQVYNSGDLVYELNSAMKVGQCRKLQPVWKGPFLVVDVLSPVLIRIRGRKGNDRSVPMWMSRMGNRWLNTDVRHDDPVEKSSDPVEEASDPSGVSKEPVITAQDLYKKNRGDRTEAILGGLRGCLKTQSL